MTAPKPWRIAITDPQLPSPQSWLQAAAALVQSGNLPWLHLRAKTLSHPQRLHAAQVLAPLCRTHHTGLIINGDLDIALAVGADALHLPSQAPAIKRPPQLRHLMRACHSLEDIHKAASQSVDLVTLSPIFPPNSKQDHRPTLGLDGLSRIVQHSPLPIIALGGITQDNAQACVEAGAVGTAAIGWFFGGGGKVV